MEWKEWKLDLLPTTLLAAGVPLQDRREINLGISPSTKLSDSVPI